LQANLGLLAACAQLRQLTSCPVLIGASRKRFLTEITGGEITGQPVEERDAATVGACLAGIRGGANIVRVHNVAMTAAAVQVYCAAGQAA
jgi:dihydropteroate synthase